jgi:DNA-directed RNA polymerase beta' subunit
MAQRVKTQKLKAKKSMLKIFSLEKFRYLQKKQKHAKSIRDIYSFKQNKINKQLLQKTPFLVFILSQFLTEKILQDKIEKEICIYFNKKNSSPWRSLFKQRRPLGFASSLLIPALAGTEVNTKGIRDPWISPKGKASKAKSKAENLVSFYLPFSSFKSLFVSLRFSVILKLPIRRLKTQMTNRQETKNSQISSSLPLKRKLRIPQIKELVGSTSAEVIKTKTFALKNRRNLRFLKNRFVFLKNSTFGLSKKSKEAFFSLENFSQKVVLFFLQKNKIKLQKTKGTLIFSEKKQGHQKIKTRQGRSKTQRNKELKSFPFSYEKSGKKKETLFNKIERSFSLFSLLPTKKANFKKPYSKKRQGTKKAEFRNPFYCISHRYLWEKDQYWHVFLIYASAPINIDDFVINQYKNRTVRENFSPLRGSPLTPKVNLKKVGNPLAGAGILKKLVSEFDLKELKKIDKQNRILLYEFSKQILRFKQMVQKGIANKEEKKLLQQLCESRDHFIRKTKLIRKFMRQNSYPEFIILSTLPVLPPDLRPILKIDGKVAASDLNRLYQRVIYRNDRLKRFLRDPAIRSSFEIKYAQRLLQEGVDNLLQNGKTGTGTERDSRGRALKSLSDALKGKQGRFRQYLLGKRVDYSGRSVIVVGPKLKLHECGLPKDMAIELFLPFIIQKILHYKFAHTIVGAKTIIRLKSPLLWDIVEEILQNQPILLNRAPTLHRLGIQAFQPKLVDGKAILLHPLVCPAFNADFDGDQMAVHVPITVESRTEAWKLMLSRNHLISSATGEPLLLPSQDIVLGCYYLTTETTHFSQNSKTALLEADQKGIYRVKTQAKKKNKHNNFLNKNWALGITRRVRLPLLSFNSLETVLKAYDQQKLFLHSSIWLKWNFSFEDGGCQSLPLEICVDLFGNWREFRPKSLRRYHFHGKLLTQYIRTTPGRILFHQILKNCTKSNIFTDNP